MDTCSKNSWLLGRPCKEEVTFLKKLWACKVCCWSIDHSEIAFFSSCNCNFLKLYQTDYPMIPFLFLDIKAILRTLLAIVVKPDVLEKYNTAIRMIEIDLNEEKNAMKPKDIHMGFSAETEILKQLWTDSCSGKDVENVRKEAAKFISALVLKITGRCPLRSVILWTAVSFGPFQMQSKSAEILRRKVKVLIQKSQGLDFCCRWQGFNSILWYAGAQSEGFS